MTTATKPQAYTNDWLGNTAISAVIQEIGEDDKWHVLGQCLDTPNAIAKELSNPVYQGHSVWIKTAFGRRYHGLVG